MLIRAVVEYNDNGYLIFVDNFPGAYARGRTKEDAVGKIEPEISQFILWSANRQFHHDEPLEIQVVQEQYSPLQICDADSDVIFETEKSPLSYEAYSELSALALKSARDFEELYVSIPDKHLTTLKKRETFYGTVPRTADEMYEHTNNVTNYYVGEIGIVVDNLPRITDNRMNVLKNVESSLRFPNNTVYTGSYKEQWSLKKVLRRFIWHDRIHAKAMYRMATRIWGKEVIANPFFFDC